MASALRASRRCKRKARTDASIDAVIDACTRARSNAGCLEELIVSVLMPDILRIGYQDIGCPDLAS
jgi:hypothetical protein